MDTSVVIDKRDNLFPQSQMCLTAKDGIYSVRRLSKAFKIRSEGFMVLFTLCDSYNNNHRPITVYGIIKALNLSNSDNVRIWKMLTCLIGKGLVEVVSMGNVHKYYIPTDKALEQISPLLR